MLFLLNFFPYKQNLAEERKEKNIREGEGEIFSESRSKQEESKLVQNIIIVQRKYSDDFEWAYHGIFHLLGHILLLDPLLSDYPGLADF